MRKLLITGLVVSALVLVFAAPAVAQEDYPPPSVLGEDVVREPEVGRPTQAGPRGPLPFTGADSMTLALLGAAALAAGSVLVIAARRRRHVLSRA